MATAMLPEEDDVGPMEQVFTTPELLEMILEYSASGEPWNTTRNLRLVCKKWRDLSLKALFSSTDLPKVMMITNQASGYDKGLEVYQYSMNKLLWQHPLQPALPVHVQIHGEINQDVLQFLADYGPLIAGVDITTRKEMFDELNNFQLKIAPVPENMKFNMINLKRLKLCMYNCRHYSVFYGYSAFKGLVDKLLENASRLSVFKCSFEPRTSRDTLPATLTHMKISTTFTDLQKLLTSKQLHRLVKLEVDIEEPRWFFLPNGRIEKKIQPIDLHTMGCLLDKFYPRLETFVLAVRTDVETVGALTLLKSTRLKTLSLGVPAVTKDGRGLSQTVPNLQDLSLRVGEKQIPDLNFFLERGSVYEKLKILSIRCWDVSKSKKTEILESGQVELPECPSLEVLKWSGFLNQLCVPFMSAVFSKWKTLKKLSIGLEQDKEFDDVTLTVLTGLSAHDIPKNEQIWSGFLDGRTHTIRNLTSLKSLTLSYGGPKGKLDMVSPFLFKAALLRMQNLKNLLLTGSLRVDPQTMQEWRADNRKLSFSRPLYLRY